MAENAHACQEKNTRLLALPPRLPKVQGCFELGHCCWFEAAGWLEGTLDESGLAGTEADFF